MDLIAREAPGALGEGLGASQGFLEDPRAVPWPQAVLRDSKAVLVVEVPS